MNDSGFLGIPNHQWQIQDAVQIIIRNARICSVLQKLSVLEQLCTVGSVLLRSPIGESQSVQLYKSSGIPVES